MRPSHLLRLALGLVAATVAGVVAQAPAASTAASASSSAQSPAAATTSSAASLAASATTSVSVSVTSTSTAAASPAPTCPVCFNCNSMGCRNFGQCTSAGVCVCPQGLGGQDCLTPTCGSTNTDNSLRPLRAAGTNCTCDTGFVGINCNACTSDSACQTPPGTAPTTNAVCNKKPKVWKKSTTYCDINSSLLTSAFPLESKILIERDLKNQSTLGSLWYNNNQEFMCLMTNCTQHVINSVYTWYCPSLSCQCTPGSLFCGGPGATLDLTNTIEVASGDFKFTCPQNSTECNAAFQFLNALFPTGIDLPNCSFGECALPSDEPPDDDVTIVEEALTSAEKAGIGITAGIVAIMLAGLVWAAIFQAKAKRRPIPPPRKGATIGFDKISYSITGKGQILSGVSGVAPAGQVLAIMGPSGAGKSTFLDIIAGKSKNGRVYGSIAVDGQAVNKNTLRSLVGFVDQEDLLMPTLTVRETLMFSATLRLPESITAKEKMKRVEEVMESLGLSHVAESRIGGFGSRGISGGERRRVSIGVELVTSPGILLLDEPTSGLDSFNALSVIRTLADLAHNHGKTIIFTIHQPRSDVYMLFDEVLVLAGGTPLYSGRRTSISAHFTSAGTPCPEGYNMADHLLDLATEKGPRGLDVERKTSTSSDSSRRGLRQRLFGMKRKTDGIEVALQPMESVAIGNGHARSQSDGDKTILVPTRQQSASGVRSSPPESPTDDSPVQDDRSNSTNGQEVLAGEVAVGSVGSHHEVGFLTQLTALSVRAARHLVRTPSLLLSHFALAIALGIFVGGLYFHSNTSLGGIQNRLGSLVFLLALLGFSGLSAIGSFASERPLIIRERSNGFYSWGPLFLTRVVFDTIALRVVPAFIMGSIVFGMIGLTSGGDHFLKFIIALLLFAAQIGLLCLSFAIAVGDIGTSTLVASIVILFMMLFAGFLINQDDIPAPLHWIQYLSFFRYAYEALVVNDLTGVQIVDSIAGASVNIPASIILTKFGFDINAYWRDIFVSIGVTGLLLVLVAMLSHWRLKERR